MLEIADIKEILGKGGLILDGGMATELCRLGYDGSDQSIVLTHNDAVAEVHRMYIDAGCDIITTASFNAGYEGTGVVDSGFVRKINRRAAEVAREEAVRSGRRVLVAGSICPVSDRPEAYVERISGLDEGGADVLFFETVYDLSNLRTALCCVDSFCRACGREIPVMVSATVGNTGCVLPSGETLHDFAVMVSSAANVVSAGLNCSDGVDGIDTNVRRLSSMISLPVTCHPSAGIPDSSGSYPDSPSHFATVMHRLLEEKIISIAGGCCGVGPQHIQTLVRRLSR